MVVCLQAKRTGGNQTHNYTEFFHSNLRGYSLLPVTSVIFAVDEPCGERSGIHFHLVQCLLSCRERNVKKHELQAFITWRTAEGIICTEARAGVDIVLEHAVENSLVVNELCRGRMRPLLIDLKNLKSITAQARSYFSLSGRESYVNAFAFIVHSRFQRMVGNIFIQFNRPRVPVRLFNDEIQAVEWLRQYLPQAPSA